MKTGDVASLHQAVRAGVDKPIEPGDHLCGYHVVRPLGRGGSAEVFLARNETTGAAAALKLSGSSSPESKVLPGLDHPNIISVLAVHQRGHGALLAMEYIDGPVLSSLANQIHGHRPWKHKVAHVLGRVTHAAERDRDSPCDAWVTRSRNDFVRFACHVVCDVARGLSHAHQQGISHRDIKPENILLASDGRAVLADFDVAVASITGAERQNGFVGGTLSYMSPEQLAALAGLEPEIRAASGPPGTAAGVRDDLFSLGIVLYELLAGELPYQTLGADQTIIAAACEALPERREAIRVVRRNTDVPIALRAVIEACLSGSVLCEGRSPLYYRSAEQLADDLSCVSALKPLKHAIEPLPAGIVRHIRRGRTAILLTFCAAVLALGALTAGINAAHRRLDQVDQFAARFRHDSAALGDATDVETITGVLTGDAGLFESADVERRRFRLCYRLGVLFLQNGSPQPAIRLLERATELRTNDGSAWNDLGAARFEAGDYRQATDAFTRALALLGDHAKVLANRGAAYGALGRPNSARQDFQHALKVDSGSEIAHRQLKLLDRPSLTDRSTSIRASLTSSSER